VLCCAVWWLLCSLLPAYVICQPRPLDKRLQIGDCTRSNKRPHSLRCRHILNIEHFPGSRVKIYSSQLRLVSFSSLIERNYEYSNGRLWKSIADQYRHFGWKCIGDIASNTGYLSHCYTIAWDRLFAIVLAILLAILQKYYCRYWRYWYLYCDINNTAEDNVVKNVLSAQGTGTWAGSEHWPPKLPQNLPKVSWFLQA